MPRTATPTAPGRPVIAIVGRPNVGKSTLYNRLTGTRDALVSDLPGLTRDRREGASEIGGHAVTLVDTAGLEEADPGSIPARMRRQTETAIRTAAAVLFVVDARAGLTATDRTFADIVRQSGRPHVLVANKSEGRRSDAGFWEAYELGLGDPVAISAEHGEGLADLEDAILAALGRTAVEAPKLDRAQRRARRRGKVVEAPVADGQPGDGGEAASAEDAAGDDEAGRPIRVAIIGRPNAGKSTLVNALLGEDRMITGPEPGLTRDAVAAPLTRNGQDFLIFDTAGLRRKARITETAEKLSASDSIRALNFAEVVVLLVDAEHPLEQQDLVLASRVIDEGRALVVAVNKWDLVANKQAALKELRETVAEKLAQVPGVPLVTLSALGERGLDGLVKAIVSVHGVWNRRIPTAQLNRWIGEAMAQHAAPTAHGRRIKIRYVTQTSTRPPTFIAFCSQPDDLPGSYVRYLLKHLRDTFEMPGVPIRLSFRKQGNPFAG